MDEWKCDNCGCCCRTKGCSHYAEDGKCDIYEDRPDECRTAYAHLVYRPELSKKDFIELSKIYCKFIRELEQFNKEVGK